MIGCVTVCKEAFAKLRNSKDMRMINKHVMKCSGWGKSAELELCVFCKKLKSLHVVGECEHFMDDYSGNNCTAFEKVDDVGVRFKEALFCRSDK